MSAPFTLYHVYFGLQGGYLPDDVVHFTSQRAAFAYLRQQAQQLRDEGWTVRGSAEGGYTCQAPWHAADYHLLEWDCQIFATQEDLQAYFAHIAEY